MSFPDKQKVKKIITAKLALHEMLVNLQVEKNKKGITRNKEINKRKKSQW